MPFLDGNGVIEPFPQRPISCLRFIRRCNLEKFQRLNHGFSICVEQSLFVGSVINEELLLTITGTEMTTQQGKDPILRFDLAAKNTSQF